MVLAVEVEPMIRVTPPATMPEGRVVREGTSVVGGGWRLAGWLAVVGGWRWRWLEVGGIAS